MIILLIVFAALFGAIGQYVDKKLDNLLKEEKIDIGKVIICIELLQPLINGVRSADVTDLITNTLGGIIGYIFYLIFKPIIKKINN